MTASVSIFQLSILPQENLDALTRLEWLDLKGNLIASVGDLTNLSGLDSLQTLFLQSIEETHANPVCKDLAYMPTLRQTLPQIAFIDGTAMAHKK